MIIIPWAERPIEQARLLNPAFIAALIWSCRFLDGPHEQGSPGGTVRSP